VRDPFDHWEPLRVLFTVKTYPNPSAKYVETVCTAGIVDDGRLLRIYPVPFRLLDDESRFKKYQWMQVRARKASSDHRPESYQILEDSLRPGDVLGTERNWEDRKKWVLPQLSQSMEMLKDRQDMDSTSLGIIRPANVSRFWIRRGDDDWSEKQKANLARRELFRESSHATLQKIPWHFGYDFTCDDSRCRGHSYQVFDWEVPQSYRAWAQKYRHDWQDKMQETYGRRLIETCDLQFFVGTIAGHPQNWTIIGLFYPPLPKATLQVGWRDVHEAREGVSESQTVTQPGLDFEAE